MSFIYHRTVRLSDTDAAGVVYFTRLLSMCHEAYEESIAVAGINLKEFFNNSSTAIPIVRAEVNFFNPIFSGDKLLINLIPQCLSNKEFEIAYQIFTASSSQECLAKANTKHVCINPQSRIKIQLPVEIIQWLETF